MLSAKWGEGERWFFLGVRLVGVKRGCGAGGVIIGFGRSRNEVKILFCFDIFVSTCCRFFIKNISFNIIIKLY